MRITPNEMYQITRRAQPAAQIRWFQKHFGVTLPADENGPILTQTTFEALVAKAAGVFAQSNIAPERPAVRLRKAA